MKISYIKRNDKIKGGTEMKMSMEWHKECLRRRKNNLDSKLKELERVTYEYNLSLSEYNKYKNKIKRAESEGKDGFDSERYGIIKE